MFTCNILNILSSKQTYNITSPFIEIVFILHVTRWRCCTL